MEESGRSDQGLRPQAQEYQQPDGSFSTSFFQRPGSSSDLGIRLHATGHALQFLDAALDEATFSEPWLERAVIDLVELFELTQDYPLECGGLDHGVRGSMLYRDRRFGPRDYNVPVEPTWCVPATVSNE